jgi:hypothetical protein
LIRHLSLEEGPSDNTCVLPDSVDADGRFWPKTDIRNLLSGNSTILGDEAEND